MSLALWYNKKQLKIASCIKAKVLQPLSAQDVRRSDSADREKRGKKFAVKFFLVFTQKGNEQSREEASRQGGWGMCV